MARPKEFDEDLALRQAMTLFWEQGFDGTSFSDLTARLGVNRQSLYETFGDKQSLYNTALARYLKTSRETVARVLDEKVPVRKALRNILEGSTATGCTDGKGCLCVNAMIERAPLDGEIRETTRAHLREVEAILTRRIAAAQATGEIAADRDPVALGRFFQSTILGLAVAARAFGDPADLRDQIDVALRVLD